MPEYSAGSASVRIRPNADDFVRDLRRQLRSVRDPGFEVEVSADTSRFREKTERAKREISKPVDTELDLDLTEAENKLRALRIRERANRLGIKVDVEADPSRAEQQLRLLRAREEARNIELKVDVDTSAVRRQLGGFGRTDLLVNIGVVGLAAVQPATVALVQLAGALQQVSGAALVVPGAITSAGASIGTLALGLSGVKDAYDAVSKAAQSSGQDSAAQARASVAAENQLRNAVVDSAQARKDQAQAIRDARNEQRDLNIEMRGGLISESRAVLEAQKAREDLARGKYSDIRDAALRVQEADQRVLEVRARNADTAQKLNDVNAKGVENSDRVVAANERVVRSDQQVAEAHAAVAAASDKQSAAQKAAAQAMDNLSPSAQKFVQQLVDMQPLWDRLRNSAQEPLFEGKAEEFEKFANDLAPHFETGMTRISAAWNDNITALFTSIGSTRGTGLIDRILGNTGEAQERLSKAIDPLVRGIGTLAAAGTDSLPRLADALGNVATRFANFIEAADKDGRLDKWINEGLDGMTSLGNSVLNIGQSFGAITQAAGGGGSFLQWLEDITARMKTFLESPEGQDQMREFFREGLEQLRHWGELLAKLPGAFKSLADGAQPYVSSLIDLFKTLSDLVGDHPDLVKGVLTAYLTWKTINPVIDGVRNGLGLLSSGLTGIGTGFYRTRDDAKKAMADVDSTFQKVGKGGSGLSKFSGALSALGGSAAGAGVLGALATVAIPGVITALQYLDQKNQESAEQVRNFESDVRNLESTLDRTTGKVTALTRSKAIEGARNYDASGEPGGGIPGISKGNALSAAESLGIAPDLYADALVGKPEATQQIRDILLKNNLVPEFQVNKDLSKRAAAISAQTGGEINQDLLLSALIGDPKALERYNAVLAEKAKGNPSLMNTADLAEIAQQLSATGQASVLSGGYLNRTLGRIPAAEQGAQQQNQAEQGRFEIKPGAGSPFPDDAKVASSGTDYRVTVPGNLADQLTQQKIPFITNPDGTLTATVPLDSPYIKKYATGGLVPGHGPRVAILHGGELVVPAAQVPRFDQGGVVDEHGNPVTPGSAPGPAAVPNAPIASNPTSGGGGIISSLVGGITSGIQGPIGNAIGLVSSLPGVAQGLQNADAAIQLPDMPAMTQAGTPGGDFASRAAGLPGFAGLFGGLASPDPKSAVTQWVGKSLNYLGNWGVNTATQAAGILWQGGLNAVGLGGSILSPSNPYTQAATQVAGFALGSDGPLAALAGLNSQGGGGGFAVDPTGLASQYGVTLDSDTLRALYSGATPGATGSGADWEAIAQRESSGNWQAPSDNSGGPYRGGLQILDSTWQQFGGTAYAPTADKASKAQQIEIAEKILAAQGPGAWPNTFAWKTAASSGSGSGGSGNGLQINTLKGKHAIQANFPWATDIGGVRADALKWHPSGLALDVMIPGAGGLNDPTPAAGKAQGDQLYAWLKQHQSELGIDYILWQQKDHFNHLHVNFAPSGFPGMESGGPTPSRKGPGPTGGFLAEVHPDEFMISARGRATVPDAFLHRLNAGLVDPKELPGLAAGGPPPTGVVVPPPRPNFQVPNAKTITPAPAPRPTTVVPQTPPSAPTPAPAPQTVAPVAPTPAPAAQAPAKGPAASGSAAPTVAPAPKSLNHNLDWINTAIQSGAATLGNLAATAASMGIGAAGGGPLGGLAGSLIAGGFQQGGKIVQGLANVVSSALVGSVPGSFGGEPGARAYGQSVLHEQSFPDLRMSAGGNKTYNFNGISDVDRLMNRMELADNVAFQAEMANHRR
ncbi:transglycosylase family protein [Mycobacterium sp. PSTR-4-N]|uniref:transglycosylase family protein n=1 Tax=Mycobacterium sp. PSTR-4-N TaxID=2917745 RepID=UPI00272BD7AC|nr:transglycosylase family protein [Mycobacterium sp. PSTR-4-N]